MHSRIVIYACFYVNRFERFAGSLLVLPLAWAIWSAAAPSPAARPDGNLRVEMVEAGTGQPLPVRVHLRNAKGRPITPRGLGIAGHADHFYLDGQGVLELRRGMYRFDMDAGAERRTQSGHFEIQRHAEDTKRVEFKRFADLAEEGWFAADLDVERHPNGLAIAVQAEGLDYLPLTAWRTGRRGMQPTTTSTKLDSEAIVLDTARVDDAGGALLFCLPGESLSRERLPSKGDVSLPALQAARDRGYRIVAADMAAWRLPVWLAGDVLDSAIVVSSATNADEAFRNDRSFYPPSKVLYPGPRDAMRWREAIYFHVLNAGLRLPPGAGSGSGDLPTPLGSARVYVKSNGPITPTTWWEALLDGRAVVTNGPLLRPNVYGEPPGFVFPLDGAGQFDAAIGLNLSTRQTIDYLELVQNGEAVINVSLAEFVEKQGQLPKLDFDSPGWFAVRAVTNNAKSYQLALSAPWYVGADSRISRASCRFFLDWLDAYAKHLSDKSEAWRHEEIDVARRFWRERLQQANAE